MNKRGELTSQQIVTIVILIISFAVILLFFYFFGFKEEVSKESCRNSVMLRGTAVSRGVVNLECETKDICISMGGQCKNALVKTETIKVRNKAELFEQLSNLMYDCWWQMGEGKVDYVQSGMGFDKDNICHICNTISFDEAVKKNKAFKDMKMGEFYKYLKTRKVENKDISYFAYFYGTEDLDKMRNSILEESGKSGNGVDIFEVPFDLTQDKKYAIITGESKSGWGKTIAGAIGGAVALGAIGYFTGGLGYLALAGTGGGGIITYAITGDSVTYIHPMIYPFDSKEIQSLKCGAFSSLS